MTNLQDKKIDKFKSFNKEDWSSAYQNVEKELTNELLKISKGSNSHHIVEACFKAFSRAMRMATEIDLRRSDSIPSSKGMLEKE